MKRILITLALLSVLSGTGNAQFMAQYKVDSLGIADTQETWAVIGTVWPTVLNPHYPLKPAPLKILAGAAATLYVYEEYLMPNDSSARTRVYDTLRGPVPFYDVDNEAMDFTGTIVFDGSTIRHIQFVDPSAYGRLRVCVKSALVPGVKVMLAW